MIWKNKKLGKIFISYRRSDTQGYAGRLSDSLAAYFGENRIFRDIDDIKGGSEYAKDIEAQVNTADAVIVLIGPNWLSVRNEDGRRRIDDSGDWVAQEIATAIEQGIRIFPVLIEGTALPRKEDLPAKLVSILDYNAISIHDSNWESDILGLGKIISFDVPTTNEKILFRIQVLIYTLLSAALIVSAAMIAFSAIHQVKNPSQGISELIPLQVAAIPFYIIAAAIIVLSLILRLIAKEKQKYIIYSLIAGITVSAFFFFSVVYIKGDEIETQISESMLTFFGSVLASTLMFTFLGLSGFKPK